MAKDVHTKSVAKILHGQGKSTRHVAKECNVSEKTAAAWARDWTAKGFPKGFSEAKLAQAAEAALVKERERQGLTRARVEAKIVALMDAKKGVYSEGVKVDTVDDNGTQVAATTLGANVLKMTRDEKADALTAGIYAFYKDKVAQRRAKK